MRIQDDQISLNVPDVTKVLVYESLNKNSPTFDRIECTSTSNVDTNTVVGENIFGSNGAVARAVVRDNSVGNTLDIVYLTAEKFSIGENVTFEESNITTTLENVTNGSYKNISSSFILDKGQRSIL